MGKTDKKVTLAEHLDEVISKHAIIINGRQVILKVTQEEAGEFGLMFLRGIFSFFLGLDEVRLLRQGNHAKSPAGDYGLMEQTLDEEQFEDEKEDKEDFVN